MWWVSLFLAVLALRLCFAGVLWIEEAYPSAAAVNVLAGRELYRDFWFDKPPLEAWLYAAWGAPTGWLLRLAGACYVTLCAWLASRYGRDKTEARMGAVLVAFFLTFGIPSATMALAPDLLLVAPHLAAVWFAMEKRPLAAGVAAGIGMLANTKAVFVLAACALFAPSPLLALGFALPCAAAAAWFGVQGALHDLWRQVFVWGWMYSSDTFLARPWLEGFTRTLNWAGFHVAAVAGAAIAWWRAREWRWLIWIALTLIGVVAGWRFFPRYYFLLLVPLCVLAARARPRWVVLILLLIPLFRFGPRFVQLPAGNAAGWDDLSMYRGSLYIAHRIADTALPSDTIFVWGYRPDIDALTRLAAGTPFLESQPLTGVFADRHLTDARASAPAWAVENRARLAKTSPTWIVDGLAPYNPKLAIAQFEDLAPWLANYREYARTRTGIVYRRSTM